MLFKNFSHIIYSYNINTNSEIFIYIVKIFFYIVPNRLHLLKRYSLSFKHMIKNKLSLHFIKSFIKSIYIPWNILWSIYSYPPCIFKIFFYIKIWQVPFHSFSIITLLFIFMSSLNTYTNIFYENNTTLIIANSTLFFIIF